VAADDCSARAGGPVEEVITRSGAVGGSGGVRSGSPGGATDDVVPTGGVASTRSAVGGRAQVRRTAEHPGDCAGAETERGRGQATPISGIAGAAGADGRQSWVSKQFTKNWMKRLNR